MKKIKITMLFSALLLSLNSFAADVKFDCDHSFAKPEKPITFNEYYTIKEYNKDVVKYNKNVVKLRKCTKKYIDKVNNEIQFLEKSGNNAITITNEFVLLDEVSEKEENKE